MTRPSLAGIERDRARAARTGKCVDDTILASHVPALTAAVRDALALHVEATCSRGYPQTYCMDCGQAWPCNTVRALATRLDLTDPEGEPT